MCACAGTDAGIPGLDAGPALDGGSGSDGGSASDGGPGDCPAALTMCGDRCVDTSTDEGNCGGCGGAGGNECTIGEFCVGGVCQDVGSCPPPFLVCDGTCVDPSTNPAYCGATADCLGTSAGLGCAGACVGGRCLHESCRAALRAGHSTGDGLYLVDIDGTGPIAPQDAYCDMTTEGGGWMLVYKIRNDVADIADPWWAMVDLGSGELLPSSPTPVPSGVHFEGPTREVRVAYWRRSASVDIRGTLISASGTLVLDVWNTNQTMQPLGYVATGRTGTPSAWSPTSPLNGHVIEADSSVGLAAGAMVREGYLQSAGSADRVLISDGSTTTAILGDSSISGSGSLFVNSTTLIWIRDNLP
jgi:hypothetical protein